MNTVREVNGQHAVSYSQPKKSELKWADLELGAERGAKGRRAGYRPEPAGPTTKYTATPVNDVVSEPGDIDWDDVVDIVCIGRGAGALAAAIGAERGGMTVFFADAGTGDGADANSLAGRLGIADAETIEYLDALTEDVGPLVRCAVPNQVPVRTVEGPLERGTGRGRIATFFGSALRDWSDRCLASPYGLLYTDLAHPAMTATYASAGATLEAAVVGTIDVENGELTEGLDHWLTSRAGQLGIDESSSNMLQRLVFDDAGQVVGAMIETPSGARAIRAKRGVIMATGASTLTPTAPTEGLEDAASVAVALVTRAASRFARLELLATPLTR